MSVLDEWIEDDIGGVHLSGIYLYVLATCGMTDFEAVCDRREV